jgi:NADPH-dependent 2,4-dienoyl-CoA reductase/sulfur reductase-like enzyme/peroxiredoxin family protein/rhodanese-related sulfurtransferase/TusA-related sulfurtransferase
MKIVIVGGVAAGMSCAARLRRLDEHAQIIVFEKDEYVSFANCGLPYHIGGVIKERARLLVQTPESLKTTLNIDVRVFSTVTTIDPVAKTVAVREARTHRVYEETYDKLVLAPGAKSLRPPLPGLSHPAIFELRNMADMDGIVTRLATGAKQAVVMGGYIGIEAAENLRLRGLEVTVVEKMPQLMGPLDPEMAQLLQAEMARQGVRVLTHCSVQDFEDRGGRIAVKLERSEPIEADLVVFALGSQPNTELAQAAGLTLGPRGGIAVDNHMRTSNPDIYAGGDAVESADMVSGLPVYIPMAGPANRQGRIIADNICGRDSRYRSTQGTAILKVFDLTVAMTGLNEKTLKQTGLPYRKIYVSPSGHAGYYPGTFPMLIKLLFSPDGKRILGAQIVGRDGVDKRIDVLATAMRGNLSVWDLEHLELAYAPPYGSAKDPVNMAGFVACNLLHGDTDLWYTEEFPSLPKDITLLDVRTKADFDLWHIPGAVNLPLGQLRAQLGALDKSRTYYAYCKVGLRSYLAGRILQQNGFKVKNLAGGADVFRLFYPDPVARTQEPGPRTTLTKNEEPGTQNMNTPCGCNAPETGKTITLDCMGLQCPGPIGRLTDAVTAAAVGDLIEISASDPGFPKDMEAWCRAKGHELLETRPVAGGILTRIRKNSPAALTAPSGAPAPTGRRKKTFVVFSGDLDRVMAAFVLANGALAMADEVTLFFTFWGLSAIRKEQAVATTGKGLLDRMFGWMLPRGLSHLTLSKMHMGGMGTAMMKHVMAQKHVDTPQQLLTNARRQGLKLVACSMSMDVMGLRQEELLDGVEIGGAATFLAEANQSNVTLFV